MKILYTSLLFLMNCVLSVAQPEIIVPKPHQLKWHEAEMGAVFHYDLHVFDGIRYGQGNNRISPIEDYNIFNPTQLDTDQWIQAAKAAGCKFAVLTATHETGFGLWQSDVNPYCLKAVKWRDGKGDIVRDFVNSCRKYGIQPGIYVGIRWNSLLGIHNFKVAGDGEFAANRQAWYKRFCEKMVEELCTRYGDLYMIWFDGGADDPRGDGPDVEPIVNKYQPNCLFYHNIDRADFRWGGSETGTVGYPCWSTFPAPCSHHKRIDDYIRTGEIKSAINYCRITNTPSARMIEKGITRMGRPVADVQAAIENSGNIEVAKLENGLPVVATIAGGAPMIGFLGTVTGMVQAFWEMSNAGNNIDITLLSGGIYEAMITTVGGLVVGIAAMFAYNYLVTRVDKVVSQMEARTMDFMDLLNEPVQK